MANLEPNRSGSANNVSMTSSWHTYSSSHNFVRPPSPAPILTGQAKLRGGEYSLRLLVNCQRRGAVIERVEQQLVGAAHLSSELRPDRKKNNAAAPDRHIHNSGLAENFALPENPAAHQWIRQRIIPDGLRVARYVESGILFDKGRGLASHPVGNRIFCVDDNLQQRTGNVKILWLHAFEGILDGQRELLRRELCGFIHRDERSAFIHEIA